MCLVIAGLCFGVSYYFYDSGDVTNAMINGAVGLIFVALMVRNIIKVKRLKNK